MAGRMTDLLLRISGEDDGAERLLNETAAELNALDSIDATAELHIDDGQARADLVGFVQELDRVDGRSVTANVGVDVAKGLADLTGFVSELDRLDGRDVSANVNVDGVAEALAEIEVLKRELASLRGAGGGIGGGGPTITGGGIGGNFFGGRLLTKAIIGSIPFLPTVGASFAQGALGAGALGAAAGGAGLVGGGGIGTLAIGGIVGLGKALVGYTQDEQNAGAAAIQRAQQQDAAAASAQAASEQVANSERSLAQTRVAASISVQGAEEQLTVAQQQERYAQDALNLARRQAVRDLQDMRRQAVSADDAEVQAKINLEQARRALAQGYAQGIRGVDLRQLEENVTVAKHALTDAEIARKRAHEDANKAQRKGIAGDPGVVAARRQRASAERAVADAARNAAQTRVAASQQVEAAERAVADAERAQAEQARQAALQQKALNVSTNRFGTALKQLPPAGRVVARTIEAVRARWKELTAPGQADFFGTLGDGLAFVRQQLPLFAGSANASMSAARSAFDSFLDRLDGPQFRTFVTTMTVTFVRAIGPLTRGLGNIGEVLARIADAAAPELVKMIRSFAHWTGEWVKNTRNADDLRRRVHELVGQFWDWLHLIGAIGQVLSALFIANEGGARRGGSAVRAMTRTLQHWADWLRSHKAEVNAFFGNVLDTVGILLGALGNLAQSLAPISKAFIPISQAISSIVNALNSLKIGNVSALTVLLGYLTGRKILGMFGAGSAATAAGEGAAGGSLASRVLPLASRGVGAAGDAIAGAGGALAFAPAVAAAVAVQSLAGKPGSFLGPGIAGRTGPIGAKGSLAQDKAILGRLHEMTVEQMQKLEPEVQAQWTQFFERDPEAAQTAGAQKLISTAHDTYHAIAAEIRGSNLGSAFADSIAKGDGQIKHVLDRVKGRFMDLPTAVQDAYIKSAREQLDRLHDMGLITNAQEDRALQGLEDLQKQSFQRQINRWHTFTGHVAATFGQTFGSLVDIADAALGNKGVTGIVNQLLTGVASTKKLKWNVTTAGTVLGRIIPALTGGGAAGGFLPGYSRSDDRLLAVRGGEAILRPEDHVPFVDRALRVAHGFGLGEMFARTGAGISSGPGTFPGAAAGGQVVLGSGVNMRVGDEPMILRDLGALSKILRQVVYVISGYRTPAHSVAVGGFANDPHTQGKAADIGIGSFLRDTMFGVAESTLRKVGLYRPFYPPDAKEVNHVQLLSGGGGGSIAAAIVNALVPRLTLHGPAGALKSIGQGAIDTGRQAANRFLESLMPSVSSGAAQIPRSLDTAKGSIASIAAKAARHYRAPFKAAEALYEALIVETGDSTLRTNPNYGDASSTGVLQLLASTAAGLGVDPMNVGDVIALFLTRGFYGQGGAISLARANPSWSAGAIAQAVQGSAFPARYDQVQAIADAFLRREHLMGLPRLKAGTSHALGGWSLVGEAGPELIDLPAGARVVGARATEAILEGLGELGSIGHPASRPTGSPLDLRLVLEDRRTRVMLDHRVVREIYHDERGQDIGFETQRSRQGARR